MPHVDELHPVERAARARRRAPTRSSSRSRPPTRRAACSTPRRSAAVKPGAVLVNVGRGAVIDEAALAERLQDGTLKGAALDVFAEEPLPQDSPLWGLENVIVTPHDIALVAAEEPRIVDLFIDNLRRRRDGEPLRNALDPRSSIDRDRPDALERWSQALLEASGLGAAARRDRRRLARPRQPPRASTRTASRACRSTPSACAAGTMNGSAAPAVEREDGAVALVDADRGPGQVAGVFATDHAIELARRHGVGVVAVHRSSHYGAAGYYAIRVAEAGMVGVSTTNSEPFVVPYGGVDHALGTNPIALAAPTPDGIFDTDMATSQVAVNKIFNARDEGRTIPEGWGVDEAGRATTDPAAGLRRRAARRLQGLRARAPGRGPLRRAVGLRRRPRHRPHLRGRAARTSATSTSRSTSSALAGREHAAAAARRGCSATSRRSRPRPASTRCSSPASRSARTQAERERDGIPLPADAVDRPHQLSSSSASSACVRPPT